MMTGNNGTKHERRPSSLPLSLALLEMFVWLPQNLSERGKLNRERVTYRQASRPHQTEPRALHC